jgi:hypothetical protein
MDFINRVLPGRPIKRQSKALPIVGVVTLWHLHLVSIAVALCWDAVGRNVSERGGDRAVNALLCGKDPMKRTEIPTLPLPFDEALHGAADADPSGIGDNGISIDTAVKAAPAISLGVIHPNLPRFDCIHEIFRFKRTPGPRRGDIPIAVQDRDEATLGLVTELRVECVGDSGAVGFSHRPPFFHIVSNNISIAIFGKRFGNHVLKKDNRSVHSHFQAPFQQYRGVLLSSITGETYMASSFTEFFHRVSTALFVTTKCETKLMGAVK